MIKEKIIKTKENIINKLNETRENVDIQIGPVYLNDKRGGKNRISKSNRDRNRRRP